MKIFKYILFLILIFVIGGSIYIATQEGHYKIDYEETINAPQQMVYNEVLDLKNWEYWLPWSFTKIEFKNIKNDTIDINKPYLQWESSVIGDGNLTTHEALAYSSIVQQLKVENFLGESNGKMYWNFEAIAPQKTKVTWGIKGKKSFKDKLAELITGESTIEQLKPKLKEGLDNIEEVVLRKMNKYNITTEGVVQYGGGYYLYSSTSSKLSQISNKMRPIVQAIDAFMNKNEIEKIGNPLVVYNEYNTSNNSVIFSAGYFTSTQITTPINSNILSGKIPTQKALKTILKGNYKNLEKAWQKSYQYIEENRLEIDSTRHRFQVYLSDPDKVVNPAKWNTHLYIPIK
ncbi:GyrI-like domain-containing protein [Zunongwangia sp.]|uniref:GyrI-like domain-containing protein n=1 Tax=Zunongwangia sp. TaxID=1965325 RepID=UPI003AA7D4A6